jgi:hypothetical protein
MPPIRQNWWTYNIFARDRPATHTPKWIYQSEHCYLHATHTPKTDGPIASLRATTMPPIRQNGMTNQNILPSCHQCAKLGGHKNSRYRHATHTPNLVEYKNFRATEMPPISQNGRANENITTSVPPIRQIDALVPFLQAPTMPPIRQSGQANQNIIISMPPIRQNGWTNAFLHATAMPPIRQNGRTNVSITTSVPQIRQIDGLVPCLHATSTPPIRQSGRTNQIISTSMSPIRRNWWTNNIFARDPHATHTSRLTDQSEHHYLHATPYAKMNGFKPFLHATTMPPIR